MRRRTVPRAVRGRFAETGIPALAGLGLTPEPIPELARQTAAGSITKVNPVELNGDEIAALPRSR